jgi:hypothetical protein
MDARCRLEEWESGVFARRAAQRRILRISTTASWLLLDHQPLKPACLGPLERSVPFDL